MVLAPCIPGTRLDGQREPWLPGPCSPIGYGRGLGRLNLGLQDVGMITALRTRTPTQVREAVGGFAQKYVHDWERWLLASPEDRPKLFVKTLGKWQAARPAKLRRLRVRAGEHHPPYIEDLLGSAAAHLRDLANFDVGRAALPSRAERAALAGLWKTFSSLQQAGIASCVAITKAVLLVSDGRIGPAFDSQVRKQLGVGHLLSAREWIAILAEVSDDIQAFERKHRISLTTTVPREFATLGYGRLYDMALGPRSPNKDLQPTAAGVNRRHG